MSGYDNASGHRMLVIAVAAASIAGCGTSAKPKTDAEQIRAAYKSFAKALTKKDGKAACSLVTPKARAGLMVAAAFMSDQPDSCADAVKTIAAETPKKDLADTKLVNLRVTGDTATAKDSDGETEGFKRVDGRWLISSDDEVKPADTAKPAPRSDDCEKLGINSTQLRTGKCSTKGVDLKVINKTQTGHIGDIAVRLVGASTASQITGTFGDAVKPNGMFVRMRVAVTNVGNSPVTIDADRFQLSLADTSNNPTSDPSLDNTWDGVDALGPGLSKTREVVFDVAAKYARQLGTNGNLLMADPADEGWPEDPTSRVLLIRTYR